MTKLRVLVLCFSYFTDNSNAHQITSSAAAAAGLPLLIPILKNTNHKLELQSSSTQLVNCVWGEVRGVVSSLMLHINKDKY
jgi:hypothetical protein